MPAAPEPQFIPPNIIAQCQVISPLHGGVRCLDRPGFMFIANERGACLHFDNSRVRAEICYLVHNRCASEIRASRCHAAAAARLAPLSAQTMGRDVRKCFVHPSVRPSVRRPPFEWSAFSALVRLGASLPPSPLGWN